jgi:hypothetical protein
MIALPTSPRNIVVSFLSFLIHIYELDFGYDPPTPLFPPKKFGETIFGLRSLSDEGRNVMTAFGGFCVACHNFLIIQRTNGKQEGRSYSRIEFRTRIKLPRKLTSRTYPCAI